MCSQTKPMPSRPCTRHSVCRASMIVGSYPLSLSEGTVLLLTTGSWEGHAGYELSYAGCKKYKRGLYYSHSPQIRYGYLEGWRWHCTESGIVGSRCKLGNPWHRGIPAHRSWANCRRPKPTTIVGQTQSWKARSRCGSQDGAAGKLAGVCSVLL